MGNRKEAGRGASEAFGRKTREPESRTLRGKDRRRNGQAASVVKVGSRGAFGRAGGREAGLRERGTAGQPARASPRSRPSGRDHVGSPSGQARREGVRGLFGAKLGRPRRSTWRLLCVWGPEIVSRRPRLRPARLPPPIPPSGQNKTRPHRSAAGFAVPGNVRVYRTCAAPAYRQQEYLSTRFCGATKILSRFCNFRALTA